MKKLLILIITLLVINLFLSIIVVSNILDGVKDFGLYNKCDTIINRLRIDSIEYIIKSKDSVINKIKYDEEKYIKQANELSDTASVELFKRLVSE